MKYTNVIKLGESLGLKYVGRDEGHPEFLGETKQFEAFEKAKEGLIICNTCEGTEEIDVLLNDANGTTIFCPDCQKDYYDEIKDYGTVEADFSGASDNLKDNDR